MAAADPLKLIALHGFGACAAVFDPLKQLAAGNPEILALDLPGHGGRRTNAAPSLDSLAGDVARRLEQPAVWLGWSLGGLVALWAARQYPDRAAAVITLAMGPRFLAADDWAHGLSPNALNEFQAELEKHPDRAMARFYALQTHSHRGPSPRLSRRLGALAGARGRPDPGVMRATLSILASADLRLQTAEIRCPLFSILGSDDALVPVSLAAALPKLNPRWRVATIEAAGHVPFLSHPEEVLSLLRQFVCQLARPPAGVEP